MAARKNASPVWKKLARRWSSIEMGGKEGDFVLAGFLAGMEGDPAQVPPKPPETSALAETRPASEKPEETPQAEGERKPKGSRKSA